ncbi:MAG: galactokinase family protein, partial [Spirochaetota bacterium]|nr:galactokinase family protein [Spirochaetota bacterium]
MNKIDKFLETNNGKAFFAELYGHSAERLTDEKNRYKELCNTFVEKFGSENYTLFNNPGRTELGGNHTDHNNGIVLAGSVNLDI